MQNTLLERLQLAIKRTQANKARFREQLRCFIRHYRLSPWEYRRLYQELTYRPREVESSEKMILARGDPRHLSMPWKVDNDTAALLHAWRRVTVEDLIEGRTPGISITWQSLSRKERDAAGKLANRHGEKKISFREGRPPYQYPDLVRLYAKVITEAILGSPRLAKLRRRKAQTPGQLRYLARDLPFSGDRNSGPAMRLLRAALDFSLPVTGTPKPSTIRDILA